MQTLQKIEFDNLATFLAAINNNFAIIQNSPLFKGIPGEQGETGNVGPQGDRGTKIFPVIFDKFREVFSELEGQYVGALTPDWINSKLLNDDESSTNFNKICDALGLVDDTLLDGDLLLFATDLSIYSYSADDNQVHDTGIKFSTDINIQETINNMVAHSMEEYLNQLNSIRVYIKEYTTIASNDGNTAAPTVSNATTYFPYLPIGNMPRRIDVSNTDNLLVKHKYFGIDDTQINQSNDYYVDSSFGITEIIGSIREYVKILRRGTNQNLSGNIVNPTNSRMPALVVMQNNYNSGLLIGHKNSQTMADFALVYKDNAGALHIKREHKWNLNQSVTEFIVASGYFSMNSNFKLIDHANMMSDFLTSNYGNRTLDVGYTDNNSLITFKSKVLNYAQFTPNKIMELDKSRNLLTSKNFDVEFEASLSATNYRTRLSQYFGNLTDATAIYRIPSQKTIKYVFKTFETMLDNVWYKPQYYSLISDVSVSHFTNDIIPAIKLHSDMVVGSDYMATGITAADGTNPIENEQQEANVNQPADRGGSDTGNRAGRTYPTRNHPLEIHLINIGSYNLGYDVMYIGRYAQNNKRLNSKLKLSVDWYQLIFEKLAYRSVLTVGDNHIVDEDFQYADWTNSKNDFEYLVSQDVRNYWKKDDFDFTKYSNRHWNDANGVSREGFSGANNMSTDLLTRAKRYLTGKHFRVIMVIFNELSTWIKNLFANIQEQQQTIETDVVPEGVVVPYNPPINMKNGVDYKTFYIPENWIPCLGGYLLETSLADPRLPSGQINKYLVPDMRSKSVIGYDWTLNSATDLYNSVGQFTTMAHVQWKEVEKYHFTVASNGNKYSSLLSATNYLSRDDEYVRTHNNSSITPETEVDSKIGENGRPDLRLVFGLYEQDYLLEYHASEKAGLVYETYSKFNHMHPFVRLVYIQKAVKPKASPDNYIWYVVNFKGTTYYVPVIYPGARPNVVQISDGTAIGNDVNQSYAVFGNTTNKDDSANSQSSNSSADARNENQ